MSWLFGGTKKPSGKTVLVLDIESGSVGAGLVRLSKDKLPRLFAETRVHTPLLRTRDATDLALILEKAAKEALQRTSLVAARVRNSGLGSLGEVSDVHIFLHAPWSTPTTRPNGWAWNHEPLLTQGLQSSLQSNFAATPATFHPFANAAIHATHTAFEQQENFLLCIVTSEVAELLLVQGGVFVGRATIPLGTNLPVRTLQSHGGITLAEAHSILELARHGTPKRYSEPLDAAATHFTHTFADAIQEIVADNKVYSVLVVGREPGATWIARALSENASTAHNLFTDGAVVRTLHTRHLQPHTAVHTPIPDEALLAEAIFVGNFN